MVIKIVADSTCDLPAALVKEFDIHVVPLYVNFDMQSYRDGVNLTPEEFYTQLTQNKVLPKTAQPTVEDLKAAYEAVADTADAIISVHLSSKMSGTYNAALQAAKVAKVKCPIHVIDSEQVSGGIGLLILSIAKAAAQEQNIQSLLKYAEEIKSKIEVRVVLDTLDYLVRGGRIGKAKGLIGKLINIKPVLTVKEGEVHNHTKTRSYAKSIELLQKTILQNAPLKEFCIISAMNVADAQALAENVKKLAGIDISYLGIFGPTMGVYVGAKALGIAFIRD